MATNITVKTRIRVNGQEYASEDDMPPAIRQAYERAMANVRSGAARGLVKASGVSADAHVRTKITFNGQEFDSAAAMPTAIRKLYDDVMATLDAEPSSGRDAGAVQAQLPVGGSLSVSESAIAMKAARPESTTARLLVAGVVIAALLLASVILRR